MYSSPFLLSGVTYVMVNFFGSNCFFVSASACNFVSSSPICCLRLESFNVRKFSGALTLDGFDSAARVRTTNLLRGSVAGNNLKREGA